MKIIRMITLLNGLYPLPLFEKTESVSKVYEDPQYKHRRRQSPEVISKLSSMHRDDAMQTLECHRQRQVVHLACGSLPIPAVF
jgi:hypothetical protein